MNKENSNKAINQDVIAPPTTATATNIITEWQADALLLTMQRRIAGLIATIAEPFLTDPVLAELQKMNDARIEDYIPTCADADLWEHWQDATAAGFNGQGWQTLSEAELINAAEQARAKHQISQATVAQLILLAFGYTPEDARRIFIQQKNNVKQVK